MIRTTDRRSFVAFVCVPIVAVTLAACASPVAGDPSAEPTADEATEPVGETSQAYITPRSWLSYTLVGGRTQHIKSNTGVCAAHVGNKVPTQPCDASTAATGPQKWSIYKMTGDTYNICVPSNAANVETLDRCAVSDPFGAGCLVPYSTNVYFETCVVPANYLNGKPRDYRLEKVILAEQPFNYDTFKVDTTYETQEGWMRAQPIAGTSSWYILDPDRWWTAASGSIVVPGKFSGNPDQRWSFF